MRRCVTMCIPGEEPAVLGASHGGHEGVPLGGAVGAPVGVPREDPLLLAALAHAPAVHRGAQVGRDAGGEQAGGGRGEGMII